MDATDKLVAAILAAAKVSARGAMPLEDYVAEYDTFLQFFEKREKAKTDQSNQGWMEAVKAEAERN
ncbi:hypothetical protein [Rhodoblastus sp.]|uniref:hypothetical protein n=1 Tax=Rhodoblastus sp. TaxID=1962975 RepID=UPI003F9D2A56